MLLITIAFYFSKWRLLLVMIFQFLHVLDLGKRSVCSLPVLKQGCGKCLNTVVSLSSSMKHRK